MYACHLMCVAIASVHVFIHISITCLYLMKLNNVYIAELLLTITYLFHTYTHTTLNKAVLQIIFLWNMWCWMYCEDGVLIASFYGHSCMYSKHAWMLDNNFQNLSGLLIITQLYTVVSNQSSLYHDIIV